MHPEILEIIETKDGKVLVITSDKIIVANFNLDWGINVLLHALGDFDSGGEARRDALNDKKGRLGSHTPEEILASDRDNYVVQYADVIKSEFSKGLFSSKLELFTSNDKHQFNLKNKNEYFKCMSALKPVLEDKFTVS